MTENMRSALKGVGSGLQETSGAVGDVLGNSMDMRGGQSKKSDEAGKGIKEMGRSKGETVPGTSINANDQVANQATGKADHLDLGFRKQT
ncbi:hypothetical protein Q7P36_011149 [Cladosporium allicinum]